VLQLAPPQATSLLDRAVLCMDVSPSRSLSSLLSDSEWFFSAFGILIDVATTDDGRQQRADSPSNKQ
jgi:hypothetical protein